MYHVHVSWKNTTTNSAAGSTFCGTLNAGGHYDPNLACGYSSINCNHLGRGTAAAYNCTPAAYNAGQYSFCQIGDLSGKFGIAMPNVGTKVFQHSTTLSIDYQPPYVTNFMSTKANSTMWSSVVFHCNAPSSLSFPGSSVGARVVCAKYASVPVGTSSVCSFPQTAAAVSAATLSDTTNNLNYNKSVLAKSTIAVIILAILTFVFLIISIVLTALLCCQKKAPLLTKNGEDENLSGVDHANLEAK